MALKKKIVLKWLDKPYTIDITMGLIDKIDEELNLYKLTMRMASGNIRFSHAAKLVHILLKEGGCAATHEDVYTAMFQDGLSSMKDVIEMVGEILQAVYPQQPESKKKPKKQTSAKIKNIA